MIRNQSSQKVINHQKNTPLSQNKTGVSFVKCKENTGLILRQSEYYGKELERPPSNQINVL